ncbi:MAG: IS3 family transposase [Thermoanaerobaculia bacterium]
MAAVCRALRVARSTGYLRVRPRRAGVYRRSEDMEVLLQILSVTRKRASYGYRRVWRLVNRARLERGERGYNRKRIRRVMRINDLMLPGKMRRRIDRPHTGKIQMPGSNQRWCSDGFNIRCWNDETVQVAFALDCHDREVLGHVAEARALNGSDVRLLLDRSIWSRFGEAALRTPVQIQFLSDNGGPYVSIETVLYAETLGFKPITTPVYSPESNGMAEAFVNTIKRDYVEGADLSEAQTVLRQLPAWIQDYNDSAPHSSLGFLSPKEFRAQQYTSLGV